MPYEFRILGPVGLAEDGEAVPLGPPKRQAIMAALLLEPNRPVPQSQLTNAVWSGPPPRSAGSNVRTHVAALRKVLGHRLRFHRGGYELRVEEAELDAVQFTRLAVAGRAALGSGQPMVALMQLGRALELWRGKAGDGVPRGTWLDARFVHLDQQRLEVFEDHVTARLYTLGFAEIAADLRRHLTMWPTRERCWELLMLALYRSGDPTAALAAYREAREVLVGQLGIEPGPDLQRLHQAMLQRDPALDALPGLAAVNAAGPGRSAPSCAEPSGAPGPALLVGRQDERWTLTAALREHPPAVVVAGPAGVGKSALVASVVPAVGDAFPDGYVTVELTDDWAAVDVLREVVRALEDSPPELTSDTVADLSDDYHILLNGRQLLVVLDGATDAAQVRPLLSVAGPTVVVTTRCRRLGLTEAQHLQVDPLAGQEAVDLLTKYAGAVRTGDEPEAVRELVRICDGLPLALRIAGEWLASRPWLPVGVFAAHLARQPLDGLHTGHLSVRDALAGSLLAIAAEDPLAAKVFPLLADGDAHSHEALARELGEDASRVFFALERLVDRWLVESPEPEVYRVSGLPRAFAAELRAGGA
ncbi:MAG: BTAD domain-containing putative transcriptional regulator [Natronosporangium sp.]